MGNTNAKQVGAELTVTSGFFLIFLLLTTETTSPQS